MRERGRFAIHQVCGPADDKAVDVPNGYGLKPIYRVNDHRVGRCAKEAGSLYTRYAGRPMTKQLMSPTGTASSQFTG